MFYERVGKRSDANGSGEETMNNHVCVAGFLFVCLGGWVGVVEEEKGGLNELLSYVVWWVGGWE